MSHVSLPLLVENVSNCVQRPLGLLKTPLGKWQWTVSCQTHLEIVARLTLVCFCLLPSYQFDTFSITFAHNDIRLNIYFKFRMWLYHSKSRFDCPTDCSHTSEFNLSLSNTISSRQCVLILYSSNQPTNSYMVTSRTSVNAEVPPLTDKSFTAG